jgi:hypothetical protein
MNPNIKPSEQATVAAVINPQSANSAQSSGWVSMATYEAIQALVVAGALGASATVDAKLQQAQDASGTGAKDITGKAITQLTKAGSDDNKQAIINCYAQDLDVSGGFTHVRLTITPATAACLIAGVVLGHYARYQPAAAAASVDEVV